MRDKYKRILLFNVNWLGDVLFSTAVIRNLRRNFPGSFIACAIPSRCYPVLKANPNLDELIVFDEKDRHKGVLAKLNFIRQLKAKKFDTVFLLHRSFTRALICFLAGIPERVGYYTRKRAMLLTKKIMPPDKDSLHRIDYYLNLIEKSGLILEDRYTEFFIEERDSKLVDEFLAKNSISEGDFISVINPAGNWLAKRWPAGYWADLSDRLIRELNSKVIIAGAAQDLSLANEIKGAMKQTPILASGVFNLKQLAALAKRANFFISADTGPLHIANAVGAKRIIAVFGPTSPQVTGPYPLKNVCVLTKDVGCKIPCYKVHCKDNRCMKQITPEEVMQEIWKLKI